jgi:hypothetical protein
VLSVKKSFVAGRDNKTRRRTGCDRASPVAESAGVREEEKGVRYMGQAEKRGPPALSNERVATDMCKVLTSSGSVSDRRGEEEAGGGGWRRVRHAASRTGTAWQYDNGLTQTGCLVARLLRPAPTSPSPSDQTSTPTG